MQNNFLTSIPYKFKTQDRHFQYTTAQSRHPHAKGEKWRYIGEDEAKARLTTSMEALNQIL